jgi:FtsZ-binding cell division protein ZapB
MNEKIMRYDVDLVGALVPKAYGRVVMFADHRRAMQTLSTETLDAIGMVSDDPVTNQDAIQAVRNKMAIHDSWVQEALDKVQSLQLEIAALKEELANARAAVERKQHRIEVDEQENAETVKKLGLVAANCRNGLALLLGKLSPDDPENAWDTINELRETVRNANAVLASTPEPAASGKGDKG